MGHSYWRKINQNDNFKAIMSDFLARTELKYIPTLQFDIKQTWVFEMTVYPCFSELAFCASVPAADILHINRDKNTAVV